MVQWCSISVFDTDDDSSNLSLTTTVGFSLTGKVPHCECGEQGSSPGVNQNRLACSSMVRAGTLYVQGYQFESDLANNKENAAWCKRQHIHLPALSER